MFRVDGGKEKRKYQKKTYPHSRIAGQVDRQKTVQVYRNKERGGRLQEAGGFGTGHGSSVAELGAKLEDFFSQILLNLTSVKYKC